MPSAHWKRSARKPRRLIDSCVLIAAQDHTGCARYLTALGHAHHGYVTHNILGEILSAARKFEAFERDKVLAFVLSLLLGGKLTVLPLGPVPHETLHALTGALPHLSPDDAVILAEMKELGFHCLATIDGELASRKNREALAGQNIRILDLRQS